MTSPRLPLALRVLAWRARPLLLAAALVLACALAARAAAPPPAPTVPVVVAADDLAAGTVLTAEDVRTIHLPRPAAPGTAVHDPRDVVGAVLAADVPRGLPVVPEQLAKGRFATTAPTGTVAVPVRLADPAVAALLRPGDRVDLVAGTDPWATGWAADGAGGGPVVLATAALVLEVARGEEVPGDDLRLLGAQVGPEDDPLVVVAVSDSEGHRLAAAVGGSLGAVLVQGS